VAFEGEPNEQDVLDDRVADRLGGDARAGRGYSEVIMRVLRGHRRAAAETLRREAVSCGWSGLVAASRLLAARSSALRLKIQSKKASDPLTPFIFES
jgi:hypothetical protein